MSDNRINHTPLVKTVKEKCKVCYTCVRECPAKAIKISNGQAEVIFERCIGCGNCVRVCSQHAKEVKDSIFEVKEMLDDNKKLVACVAPSFPAEFQEYDYKKFVGMLKQLGFDYVTEVSYGADLISIEYNKFVEKNHNKNYISTPCPAIVSYVEKYHPALISNLVPLASPMTAMGKVIKEEYGNDCNIVFIGPCIAKKDEAEKEENKNYIDSVLTFAELRTLFEERQIKSDNVEAVNFDPPNPSKGLIFPIGRGLLESAELKDELMENTIISADGTKTFVEVIKEFERGDLDVKFLDVLFCNGCIMGPGFTTKSTRYKRQACITTYAQKRYKELNNEEWKKNIEKHKKLDYTVKFKSDDKRLPKPSKEKIKDILKRMGKTKPEDELNCGACGYETCIEHAIAIHKGLAENEMCLPYTIEKFKDTTKELSQSYQELEKTQKALIQAEKLASMGQLAAGIAHEVNNPLGVVLLYAHLLKDNIDQESENYQDLKMIVEQADRCKKIVGGLLNFARKNKVVLNSVDINGLINHSLKTTNIPENIKVVFKPQNDNLIANVDSDQMTQVFINFITNSIEAMSEGGTLHISTKKDKDRAIVKFCDTGTGIKEEHIKKIFEPFFTTKQMGKGTGLGLAVSYGIIKMHKGQIEVESNTDPAKDKTGTCITVTIPIKRNEV